MAYTNGFLPPINIVQSQGANFACPHAVGSKQHQNCVISNAFGGIIPLHEIQNFLYMLRWQSCWNRLEGVTRWSNHWGREVTAGLASRVEPTQKRPQQDRNRRHGGSLQQRRTIFQISVYLGNGERGYAFSRAAISYPTQKAQRFTAADCDCAGSKPSNLDHPFGIWITNRIASLLGASDWVRSGRPLPMSHPQEHADRSGSRRSPAFMLWMKIGRASCRERMLQILLNMRWLHRPQVDLLFLKKNEKGPGDSNTMSYRPVGIPFVLEMIIKI